MYRNVSLLLVALLLAFPAAVRADTISTDAREAAKAVEEYFDDAGITAKIKAKFIEQKGLDSLDIHVKTTDGNVVLSGICDHLAQAALAERLALDVQGVKSVSSEFVIAE